MVIRWVAQVYSFRAESVEDNDKSDHERGVAEVEKKSSVNCTQI